jgi:hypothetical protein
MTKTIDTGLTFTAIGKAVAERSGFTPVDMSIDLATVPQETLLRLARQGAVIFVSRMFAADKDAKILESDYLDAIANMFEAWKNGKEWRVKGESKPKVKADDFVTKAIGELRKIRISLLKGDQKDIEQQKAAQLYVMEHQQEEIALWAAQFKSNFEFQQAMASKIALTLVVDDKPKGKKTDKVKVDF